MDEPSFSEVEAKVRAAFAANNIPLHDEAIRIAVHECIELHGMDGREIDAQLHYIIKQSIPDGNYSQFFNLDMTKKLG